MSDINEEKLRNMIKEKGIDAIKANPKSFFKEVGIEITDRQAQGITDQLELLQSNMEKQVLGLIILLK